MVNQTILIADDDDLLCEMLSVRLGSVGYRCLQASEGAAALTLLNSNRIDLVIMDLVMPMLSGRETLTRMRATLGLSDIPVLILSHRASEHDRKMAMAMGAAAFMAKPFCNHELAQLVEATILKAGAAKTRRLKVTVLGGAALIAAVPAPVVANPLLADAPSQLPGADLSGAVDNDNTPPPTATSSAVPIPDPAAQSPSIDLPALPIVESTAARWGLGLVQTYSWIDRSAQPDWHESSISLNYRATHRTGYTVQVDRSHRFDAVDTFVMMRGDTRIGKNASGYVALTATPNADFREKVGVRTGLASVVARGLEIGADARLGEYDDGAKLSVTPRVSYTIGDDLLIVSAGYINLFELDGEAEQVHRDGYSFRVTANPARRLSLLAGTARYPEVETQLTRMVTSYYAGSTYAITDRWRLSGSYARDRYENAFTRQAVSFGLSLRWGTFD